MGLHGPFSCVHLHVAKVAFSGILRNPKPNAPKTAGHQNTASDPAVTFAVATHLEKVAKGAAGVGDVDDMCISCWSNTSRMRDIEYVHGFCCMYLQPCSSRLVYQIEGLFDVFWLFG